MKHPPRSLADRQAVLRNRWVNSAAADDMTLLDFTRFLTALQKTRTHTALNELSRLWREKTRTKKERHEQLQSRTSVDG